MGNPHMGQIAEHGILSAAAIAFWRRLVPRLCGNGNDSLD
jgi:hypothetical protein